MAQLLFFNTVSVFQMGWLCSLQTLLHLTKVFYVVMPTPSKKKLILFLKLFGMLHGFSKSVRIGKKCVCKYQNVGGSDEVGG